MNGFHTTQHTVGQNGIAAAHRGPLANDQRDFRRGQVVFDRRRPTHRPFRVIAGEVVILRDGSAVDIVEPGEYLDPSIWQQATAIAWTDCRLVGG